jgi:hypothetical protein
MVKEQDLYNLKMQLTVQDYRSDPDDAQSVRQLVAYHEERGNVSYNTTTVPGDEQCERQDVVWLVCSLTGLPTVL